MAVPHCPTSRPHPSLQGWYFPKGAQGGAEEANGNPLPHPAKKVWHDLGILLSDECVMSIAVASCRGGAFEVRP